ncbi:MAG: polysaccharide deacetylase family protein [Actinomycetota bacterium]|nr:polysaccharide deacetylase family protein [Actinomycetota bacterium]
MTSKRNRGGHSTFRIVFLLLLLLPLTVRFSLTEAWSSNNFTNFKQTVEAKETKSLGRAIATHEPLHVLFMFSGEKHLKSFLVRYIVPGIPRCGVVIYEHDSNEPRRKKPIIGNPTFEIAESSCFSEVAWMEKNLHVRVNFLVEIRGGAIPPYRMRLKGSPLLELARAYPGRIPPNFDKVAGIRDEKPGFVSNSKPHLDQSEILEILSWIEKARLATELYVIPYQGKESAIQVERRLQIPKGTAAFLASIQHSWKNKQNFLLDEAPLEYNSAFVYRPEHLRGCLPPAVPPVIITRGNRDLPRVALTIDDGWNADPRILDLLKDWHISYTAFVVGRVAEIDPELVRDLYINGAEIANHTYTHPYVRTIVEPVIMNEIWKAEDVICAITHEIYPYFRFPGGIYLEGVLSLPSREGFRVIDWTIDSYDTRKSLVTDERKSIILSNLKPGAILLFHFGGYQTFELLRNVIPEIISRGYEITNLSGVLEGTPFLLNR